jgi:cellulose synthase operon protein C
VTHYEILNARKARRIAFLAAVLASCAVAGPAIADVPPASAIQSSNSVEKLLAEGQKAVKAGNLRAALISYKNAVGAAPRDGNARMQLGTLLMRMGDPAGAERELRQARKDGVPEAVILPPLFDVMLFRNENQLLLDQFPDPGMDSGRAAAADILKARAAALQNLNKKPEALAEMDRSLALRNDWRGLLTRARLSFQQGDIPAAMKFADQAIAKSDSPDPMLSKAGMLLSVNRYAEALELTNQLLAKHPGDAQARFARVEAYIDLKRDAEAKAEVDALLAKYPNANLGLYYRSLLLARAGDSKNAWRVAQNLPAEFRDTSPRIAIMVAEMAVRAGNAETGASMLNRVLLKIPEMAAARLRLAAIRLQQNNPEAALGALQPIQDSPDPLVIELLSNVYVKLRRDQDALNTFKRLDTATKNRTDVKRNLGILEIRTGNVDQGIKDLTLVSAKAPGDLAAADPLINALVQRKRFAEALAVADRVGKDPSKRTASLIYRGGILLSQRDNAGAEAAFNAAVSGDPKSTTALFARAQMLANTQRQAEALRDLRALLAIDGKNVPALLQLAQIAQLQGDDSTVRTSLNQAIAAAPRNMTPRFALVNYLNSQRKFSEAQTAAGELLRVQPNHTDGLAALGRIQLAQKQNKEAVATYRRLVSLMPTAPGPQVLLGNALSISGDRAGAARALDTAAKLGPNSVEIKGAQINFQFNQGNNEAALGLARAFQASNPGSAADVLLASTLDRTRRRDEAIAVLNKSVSDRPNPAVLIRLAELVKANDPERAGNLMSAWLAKNPDDLAVRLEHANLLMEQKNNAQAISQFQAVLKQDPNNIVALNNLGWLLQTSDPKRALAMLTLAQKLAPNSADVTDTLGWVKLQQKDKAGALALLNKAHAAKPGDGEITYHLAVALDANGQRPAARQLLKTLLASGAKFQDLPAANKLAAEWH